MDKLSVVQDQLNVTACGFPKQPYTPRKTHRFNTVGLVKAQLFDNSICVLIADARFEDSHNINIPSMCHVLNLSLSIFITLTLGIPHNDSRKKLDFCEGLHPIQALDNLHILVRKFPLKWVLKVFHQRIGVSLLLIRLTGRIHMWDNFPIS